MISLSTPCEGWFSLSAFKIDSNGQEIPGSRRAPVPPFKNLITDAGLDRMGAFADWLSWCQVGSGSTAPSVGDTALASRVSGSSTQQTSVLAAQPSAPYYVSRTNTYRFAAGQAAGNLSEVGVGWATTASLFSRALILDALGTPTTITVLADELLDVTYQFRQYVPELDGSGSVTLRGQVYSYISRAAFANATTTGNGWNIGAAGTSAAGQPTAAFHNAYNGAIGAITSAPAGTSSPASSVSSAAYSAASKYRDVTVTWANDAGNLSGGISAMRLTLGIGNFQFGFTPAIPKTSDDTLSLTFRHSWSRKTL